MKKTFKENALVTATAAVVFAGAANVYTGGTTGRSAKSRLPMKAFWKLKRATK